MNKVPKVDTQVVRSVKGRPWWLTPGAECCHFCDASIHAEQLAYCQGCDRPLCMLCVIFEHNPNVLCCPECVDEHREQDDL